MPRLPTVSYFLSQGEEAITPDSPTWSAPLPQSRYHGNATPPSGADGGLCYGGYFDVIRSFLEEQTFRLLKDAVSQQTRQPVKTADLSEIRIYSEKHGAFYHPARVVVFAGPLTASFVLNVAVSTVGNAHVADEYRNLCRLSRRSTAAYVPNVYGQGQVDSGGFGKIGMFLGRWFEGYHEFHLSHDPASNSVKIGVWDGARAKTHLSRDHARALYRQAAEILTACYNPETFEQVAAWHHAAGDFIARIERDQITVRLIAVRRYESPFKDTDNTVGADSRAELFLHALLIFLIRLSIKMRLDRSDGVGDILWADDIAVHGVLDGFFDALAAKPQIDCLPADLDTSFRYYLSACTKGDLLELSQAILAGLNPQDPDTAVIKKYLAAHLETLSEGLCQRDVAPEELVRT